MTILYISTVEIFDCTNSRLFFYWPKLFNLWQVMHLGIKSFYLLIHFYTEVTVLGKGLAEHWGAAIINLALEECLWSLVKFSGPVNVQKFLFSPSNTKSNLFLKNMAGDNVILSFMYWNINIICIGVITIYAQFFYGKKCIKLLKNKWNVPISFIYWCVNKVIVNYIQSI